jgi:hypothetical protein
MSQTTLIVDKKGSTKIDFKFDFKFASILCYPLGRPVQGQIFFFRLKLGVQTVANLFVFGPFLPRPRAFPLLVG